MLIYGVIFASLLLNAEWSIAQSSPQKESHADETLPVLEVTATRSKKGIINVPAALSKTSSREIRFGQRFEVESALGLDRQQTWLHHPPPIFDTLSRSPP